MAKYTIKRLTFGSAYRAGTSVNGNPTWIILFSDAQGPYKTSSDASFGYEVSNLKTGDILDVSFTKTGRIAYAKKVKK